MTICKKGNLIQIKNESHKDPKDPCLSRDLGETQTEVWSEFYTYLLRKNQMPVYLLIDQANQSLGKQKRSRAESTTHQLA